MLRCFEAFYSSTGILFLTLFLQRVGKVEICFFLLREQRFQVLLFELLKLIFFCFGRRLLCFLFVEAADTFILRRNGSEALRVVFSSGMAWMPKSKGIYSDGSSLVFESCYNRIILANFCRKVDPIKVVTITITNAIVIMNFLCWVPICRQRANAITPRTIPENQQIFNSLSVSRNYFPSSL